MQATVIAITVANRTDSVKKFRSVAGGNWNDNNRQVNLNENHTDNQNNNARFRASVVVYVLYVDFSHPPNIFPISSILLCI